MLKSEREERENSVKDDRIVNPALKRSVTPVLGGDNHIKSVLKEAPRQSQRLKPHKAATPRCSHPRATQKRSEIFRSSSVIAKGTGIVKTDGIGPSNGGVLESSINVSSAQSIPETGVSGAAGLQQGRLSPKSGLQPDAPKAWKRRERDGREEADDSTTNRSRGSPGGDFASVE